MIEYHRIESHDGGQRDVVLTTDDSDAEMAALNEMITECELEIELPEDREQDGKFHVTIPGNLVGEFSEFAYDIDNGTLENLTEKWNQEMLSELDDA